MNVLVTGTSCGIGKAIALKFLENKFNVFGFDIKESTIECDNYTHYNIDIFKSDLIKLPEIDYLINNAGVQNSNDDIDINLKGTIRITEKYGFNKNIKSILFIASASAINGAEFPYYVASKGGMVAYMKNVATRIAKFNATANAISPGGVITDLNDHILKDKDLYKKVLNETLLNKWATADEIADFAYFLTVVNKSMTGENILIDNGEILKSNFIW